MDTAWEPIDEPEPGAGGFRRDRKIDEAKDVLMAELFEANPTGVFYGRQIELRFERQFFHWITTRALNELAAEGAVGSERQEIHAGLVIRFYWSRRNRYWKRAAGRVAALVEEYAQERVGRALGNHGELMFDAALPRVGFLPAGENVSEYGGARWLGSDHDLDRVFMRDGIAYGVEIKNTLDYIELNELTIKLDMCEHLDLRPLFIMRFAPKNYVEMVRQAGGFTLLFEYQMYPPGFEGLAARLRDELGLKVGTPARVASGTVQRFLRWHEEQLGA